MENILFDMDAHALGRVLNDGGDGDGFCLKKINNISEFSSSKNNHQIII